MRHALSAAVLSVLLLTILSLGCNDSSDNEISGKRLAKHPSSTETPRRFSGISHIRIRKLALGRHALSGIR
jgi:hypothetical protein